MRVIRILLSSFELIIGLSAVAGGIGLIANKIGIPVSDLNGSIFSSFFWPGMILAVVVGGTHLIAALLIGMNSKYHLTSLAIAGFGMLIWMFTEVCIVGYHSWLQPLYFMFGILNAIAAIVLLTHKK